MTREDAKDLLDNLIGMIEDNHKSDYDTALHMAIKELEQVSKTEDDILKAIHDNCYNRSQCLGCKYLNIDTVRCKLVGVPSDWEVE